MSSPHPPACTVISGQADVTPVPEPNLVMTHQGICTSRRQPSQEAERGPTRRQWPTEEEDQSSEAGEPQGTVAKGRMADQVWGWLLLLLFLQQASACGNLTCFADYIQTLTCLWGNDPHVSSRAQYHLTATWDCGEGGNCSFTSEGAAAAARYTCFAEQSICFGNNNFEVVVKLGDEQRQVCKNEFVFQEHFKPSPPFSLRAIVSPEGYNLSWSTMYQQDEYFYLDTELQYELRYRQKGHPWERHNHLLQYTETLWLPQEFEGDTDYELQVRAKPREDSSYQGAWSDWSPKTTLRTLPRAVEDRPGDKWSLWFLLVLSPLVALVVFLGWQHQRLWKKLDIFIPSPAPFFQPLYLIHNGDFKKWVGGSISCAGAMLDNFEWSTALLDVFGMGQKPLSPSPAKEQQSGGHAPSPATFASHLPGSQDATHDQAYGHLSIDTVTVAGEFTACCPRCKGATACCALEEGQDERDAYQGILFNEGQISENLLLVDMVPPAAAQRKAFLSALESWSGHPLIETLTPFSEAGGSLGRKKSGKEVDFFGSPPEPWTLEGLLSPEEEDMASYRDLLSPDLDADGDLLANGLDLDTIDSGFAECDCGSPVDSEFERRPTGCGSEPLGVESGETGEELLPSYVKQWVSSCHNRAQPS
ncbi:interleukin-21 receptor isoform X1 [Podarcis raffonei]|uniref:interleukin-21 receptor isoform X1 n=2 Tax=Podarcis raffonei TaxID=65483 RepID=UPI0023292007|nr:interleukin-21 receptor isoform X1 [Podarcis raffonei]